MRWLCVIGAAFNALLLIATMNPWFALGALGFVIGAAALAWLEAIQARVVRELSKTCQCPVCKANRNEHKDQN
jgi:hypothetical protein